MLATFFMSSGSVLDTYLGKHGKLYVNVPTESLHAHLLTKISCKRILSNLAVLYKTSIKSFCDTQKIKKKTAENFKLELPRSETFGAIPT